MKNKKILFMLLLVFVLLLGGATVLYRQLGQTVAADQLAAQEMQQEDATDTSQNTKAPDFVVYDAAGNAVRLHDFKGKPVVLNFWASWCGPCQMEMPGFQEKYLELGDEVQFMMVNMTDGSRETTDSAAKYIEENEYTFPVFYDTEFQAAYAYGAYSLPVTYFINADGDAIAQASGAIDTETLQRGIDMIR